jgi:hypothetical protein
MSALLAALLVVGGAVLVAAGAGVRLQGSPTPPGGAASHAGLQRSPPGPTAPSTPARLLVPSAGVDAAVEPVGLTPDGDMDVPRDPADVGWYASGPPPGRPGGAVIDGHLDSVDGPAVFWRLGHVRPGDALRVTDGGGRTLSFRVVRVAGYDADQPPPPELFSSGGRPRLSLITCAGDWDGAEYSRRLVVEATLG